jgi:hypothetical protein
MYISYKNLCSKIFTPEGYSFLQPGSFHILGKNIRVINDNYGNHAIFSLYENDEEFLIKIAYPDAQIWMDAITEYDNKLGEVIYFDFIEKKKDMIINNSDDIRNLKNIIELYKLLYPGDTHLDIVRHNQKIYLTKGVF